MQIENSKISESKQTFPFIDAASTTLDVKEYCDNLGLDTLYISSEDNVEDIINSHSNLRFCLSGSDPGIESAIRVNRSIGLMPDKGFAV